MPLCVCVHALMCSHLSELVSVCILCKHEMIMVEN